MQYVYIRAVINTVPLDASSFGERRETPCKQITARNMDDALKMLIFAQVGEVRPGQ